MFIQAAYCKHASTDYVIAFLRRSAGADAYRIGQIPGRGPVGADPTKALRILMIGMTAEHAYPDLFLHNSRNTGLQILADSFWLKFEK